jgi:hypothetical protein
MVRRRAAPDTDLAKRVINRLAAFDRNAAPGAS